MAGEVIRDVVIRVRVEHPETRAFDAAKKQSGEAVNAAERAEQAVKKETNAVKTLEQQLSKATVEIRKASEAAVRGNAAAVASLDKWIAQEQKLIAAIKARDAVETEARRRAGLPTGEARGGLKQGLEAVSSSISKIALPVAIVSMVPAVAQALSGAIGGMAWSIFGTNQEAASKGSPFINSLGPTNKVMGSGVSDAAGLALNSGPMRAMLDSAAGEFVTGIQRAISGTSWKDFADRFQESRGGSAQAAPNMLEEELRTRRDYIDALKGLKDRERTMLQKDLASYQERIKLNEQIIASEQARIDAAKEQFGLLDAREKQDFLGIVGKVKESGVGSLSKEELAMIRGNAAFTDILSEEAKKSADASGFEAVIEALGLDKEIKRAEAQWEINVEQAQRITLELSNIDAALEKAKEGLIEVQRKFSEELLAKVSAEMTRVVRDMRGPSF